jgi:anti-sigma28 factor (negative regulator of flagellin synthesis)
MKILPGTQQAAPATETAESKTDKPAAASQRKPARKPAPAADRIDFSASLDAGLKARRELQAERVQEIKSRVRAGTYQVASRDVAEKMLADSLDF